MKIQAGHRVYEVSPKAYEALKGAVLWANCLEKDKNELYYAERQKREGTRYVSDEEINRLRADVENSTEMLNERMSEMQELGIPDWAGNLALVYSREEMTKGCKYLDDFFSDYAVEEEKTEIEENDDYELE